MFRRTLAAAVLGMLALMPPRPASAHPHVSVSVKSTLITDAAGKVFAIRHAWTFDEAFSAYSITGLDTDKDGTLSRDELAPLAKVNIESLHEYAFFTELKQGKTRTEFMTPTDYALSHDGKSLTLQFVLPVKGDAPHVKDARFEVFDPSYFVAFNLAEGEAVAVEGASCTARIKRPKPQISQRLSQLSESFFEALTSKDATADWATIVQFECK